MRDRVRMEGTCDCGAACLAMVLGMRRASDVYPALGYDPSMTAVQGVGDLELIEALRKFGKRSIYVQSKEDTVRSWKCTIADLTYRHCIPSEQELRHKLGAMQAGCAIVIVPSLNKEGSTHYVFCERGEVFDPSNERQYIGSAQSLPALAVIFIEE